MGFLSRINPFKKNVEEVSTPFGRVIGHVIGGRSRTREIESAAVFSCCRVLANSASILPIKIIDDHDKRFLDQRDLRLWKILNRKPNPFQTPAVFKSQIILHMILKGNYYGWLHRVKGEVFSITPMNPDYVTVTLNPFYEKEYTYRDPRKNGMEFKLTYKDVVHIPGVVYDGALGLAIKDVANKIVQTDLEMQDYANTFFTNQATPGGIVLKHPGTLKKEAVDEIANNFDKSYSGINRHRPLILHGGLDATTLAVDNQKSQFTEQKKDIAVQICGILGVPPYMIGMLDKATFNNVEQLAIMFVTHGMLPHLVRIEEALQMACLGEDSPYALKFNVDALLRGDSKTQAEILHIERQDGVISANEWRAYKGREPVEGGDTYLQPLNMAPLGTPPQPAKV